MISKYALKVKNYIEQNSLFEKGENVIIGVSGGADSLALFLSLSELKSLLGLKLFVVHINHGIRVEAVNEAEYVKKLCEERNVPFFLKEADVLNEAKNLSIGIEEAGRKIRYGFFEEILEKNGGGKIAVAHTKNDQAETMLFNLFRGTGVKGLASIPPKRENVVRPILCMERAENEEYLNSLGIEFCIDASNYSDEYTRNRIRNNILPLVKEEVNGAAVSHMSETAGQLRDILFYVEGETNRIFETVVVTKDNREIVFDKNSFLGQNKYIRSCMVKRAIDELVPGNRDITHLHIDSVLAVSDCSGTKKVDLPYNIIVISEYKAIRFVRNCRTCESGVPMVLAPGTVQKYAFGLSFFSELVEYMPGFDYGSDRYVKCFDYDKFGCDPLIRIRESGDEITVNSSGGKKKLKDYMIDEKIPREERERIPVLANGNDIVWVVGYRISEAYKITESTRQILKISVFKED